jgi:hypothetical protein
MLTGHAELRKRIAELDLWLRELALLWQIASFAVLYRIPESIFQ